MSSLANDYCQEPLQYCKAISLQLIKINGKKNKVKKKRTRPPGSAKNILKGMEVSYIYFKEQEAKSTFKILLRPFTLE